MRRAIALIELIFAIVIIGISLLAIPNIVGVTAKSSNEAFTQEAISNGFSYMGMILAQYWDEVNTDSKYNTSILYVKSGDSELKEAVDDNGNPLGRRIGSPISTPRRFAKDINGVKLYATSPTNLGLETAETTPDDIDDFHNRTTTLKNIEATTTDSGDYKDTSITLYTQVKYVSDKTNYKLAHITFNNPFDTNVPNSSNIKLITLTITSPNDPNKFIIFRAFSSNIGAAKIKERLF